MTPRCSTCGAICNWSDDAWTCTKCGDEWDSDHGVHYVYPAEQPTWQPVRDPRDKRHVLYWRLMFRGKSVGSVSRRFGRWRPLGYSQTVSSPSGNTELGLVETRGQAEQAVIRHWELTWKA